MTSRATAAVLVAAAVAWAISGCTASEAGNDSLWSADIAQAKAAATSDFERAVFEDNTVTVAEYTEAVQRFVTCVTENGLPTFTAEDPHNTGLYSYVMTSSGTAAADADNDTYGRAADLCSPGTSALIEPLYSSMTGNPTREDESLVRVRCLDRAGLVEASYTAEQYTADETGDSFPFDRESEAAIRCFVNPGAQ
jgi:hypothetical protein